MQAMGGLSDAVALARVAQELHSLAHLLEQPVILVGLRDRNPQVIFAVRDEQRRLHIGRKLDGRPLLVGGLAGRGQSAKSELEQIRDVGLTKERVPVRDAGMPDRSLEAIS